MKKIKSIRFLLLSYLCFQYVFTQCIQVNPQPGENIWHLAASIGTVVDALANNCTLTPLTITSQGTTISTAGTYCLTSDVILSDTSTTIALSANNIVLDLNSHTITGTGGDIGAAIIINNGAQGITVRNGTIQNASSGIFIDAFSSVININNIGFIESSVTGTGCSSVTLKNLTFDGPAIHADFPDFLPQAFLAHVVLFNAYNCAVDSCVSRGVVSAFGTQLISYGYVATQSNPYNTSPIFPSTPVENIIFINSTCSFNKEQLVYDATGFFSDWNNTICENCKVTCDGDGAAIGFDIEPLQTNPIRNGTTCFINNCVVENLSAQENQGFVITPQADAPANFIIQNCDALGCYTGIEVDDYPYAQRINKLINIVIKNFRVNECATGFLFSLSNPFSNVLMQYCVANKCTNGFDVSFDSQGGHNITTLATHCTATNCSNIGFLANVISGDNAICAFNTATNNGTDYSGVTGTPKTAFSSNTRKFGDNLFN